MAQINIAHIKQISSSENQQFAVLARDVVAREVHGLAQSDIKPNSVTVLVIAVDQTASLSGADTEVQVLVSGNDWPHDANHKPVDAAAAKRHFDVLAARIHASLVEQSTRRLYVWVTPFTASGWAV